MDDGAALRRAVVARHLAWHRRWALATGGTVERRGGLEICVTGDGHGTIAFPDAAMVRERIGEVLGQLGSIGVQTLACWSLEEDRRLGTQLLAHGFAWGWQPHWMALDLGRPGEPVATLPIAPATPPFAEGLPFASRHGYPAGARHLAVREDGVVVGHVVVDPSGATAGIFELGVAPAARRRGVGRALVLAARDVARELGCTHAVLNATREGERLYRSLGFVSLGRGRSWWLRAGARPTARQAALVRALGSGDIERLTALAPSADENEEPVPGAGRPLAVACVTGQHLVASWILERRPELASRPLTDRGATLLHVAVEAGDEALLRIALARGADPEVRDPIAEATALEWARALGRLRLEALLRAHATC